MFPLCPANLTVSLFSPTILLITLLGAAAAYGGTNVLKKRIGLQGGGAAILAFLASAVAAAGAYGASMYFTGEYISWEMIPHSAAQIFTLATLAYKLTAEG